MINSGWWSGAGSISIVVPPLAAAKSRPSFVLGQSEHFFSSFPKCCSLEWAHNGTRVLLPGS